MSNNLTSIRAKIKAYYSPLRNKIRLRVQLKNELVDFQTGINCSLTEFTDNKELHIQVEDQINILAICISRFSNTDVVRNEYYKLRHDSEVKQWTEKANAFLK